MQDIAKRTGSTGLRVPCAEDDAIHARSERGTRAHRAGLKSDHQSAPHEIPALEGAARLAQGVDLRMAAGVVLALARVPPGTDDPTQRIDDDGPHRDVARLPRTVG